MKKAYTVKAGIHIEDGKTYNKGETVISDLNLCQLFPQKFKDLGLVEEEATEPLPPTKEEENEETNETLPPIKDKPRKKKRAKLADDWDD